MSFYVDTQEEAIKIGLSYFRPDLSKLSFEEIKNHPDVKTEVQKMSPILDMEGEHSYEVLVLDVKDVPVLIGSSPFRSGYDIWAIDRNSGMSRRIGP